MKTERKLSTNGLENYELWVMNIFLKTHLQLKQAYSSLPYA